MTSVSAGHIILTTAQPVGSGRPQGESNPGPPHQESRALPTLSNLCDDTSSVSAHVMFLKNETYIYNLKTAEIKTVDRPNNR